MLPVYRRALRYAYVIFSAILVLFLLAKLITTPNLLEKIVAGIFLIFVGLLFGVAVLFMTHGYLVAPFITKLLGITQHCGSLWIPKEYNVVLQREEDIYYATAFLSVRVFETFEEKMTEDIIYSEYFERAVSALKFVFKVCYIVYMKDIVKHREDLEAKRLEAQLRLSRARSEPEPDPLKIDRYEREAARWESELAKITAGERPLGFSGYLATSASGVTEEAAVAKALAQARELKSTIATALNVEVNLLSGQDLKRAFFWEYFLPEQEKELALQLS